MKWNSAYRVGLMGLILGSSVVFAQENMDAAPTTRIDPTTMSTTDSKQATPTPTPAEDATITNTLNGLISKSPMLSKLNVDIKTHQGVVTLTGTVDSDSQASALVENAQSIVGVSDVDTSNLKVKNSEQPFADMITTAKIKGLFIREKLFGEKDIAAINTSVETKNGVVYLTGVVDNQTQIDNAIDIIKKSIPGVTRVEYSVKKVQLKTSAQ